MRIEEFTLVSTVDRLEISCLLAEPESEPRAVVQFAHGIMEYKERFLPLIGFLTENGFACVINDHRGYGKSIKNTEDSGYTYGQGANGTIQDMRLLTEWLKHRYPGKKLFMYGHSMGALCALCYAKRWGNELNGLILSGLPEYNKAVGIGLKYLKARRLFKGERYRDSAVNQLMFDNYSSKFKDNPSKFSWINSDPTKVKEYEDDPGCGQLGTIDAYISLLDLMSEAYSNKNWSDISGMLPVFIAVGEDDVCAGGEKGAQKGAKYLKDLGIVRTEYKSYSKMRHEIHNEPGHEAVYQDYLNKLIAWL